MPTLAAARTLVKIIKFDPNMRKKIEVPIQISAIVLLLFSSCDTQTLTINNNALVAKTQINKYEIRIEYNKKGVSTNLHNFNAKYDYTDISYLYIDSLTGINRDSNVFISDPFQLDLYNYKSIMKSFEKYSCRGSVKVDNDSLYISLKKPVYENNNIARWENWFLNGNYKYTVIK